jgi:hypothetical protein
MRKRDIAAAIITAIAVVFLVWFIVFGGANPFKKYLNVKVTAGVDCGVLWFCWFNENVNLEYAPSAFSFAPKTFQWFCGWGGGPKPLEATLKVENPDMSIYQSRLEQGTCKDVDLVFFFRVPLDKGTGNYKITATVCGSNWWWQWSCITKEATYYYAG